MKKVMFLGLTAVVLVSCEFKVNINTDYVAEGYRLLREGETTDALQEFDYALSLDSTNAEAYGGKTICYMNLKDMTQALANVNHYIRLQPNSPAGYNNRGTIYMMTKNYQKALADFDRVIQLDSTNKVVAYFNKAEIMREQARYREAVTYYNVVLEADSNDARAYLKRGYAYMKSGRSDSACLDYEQALILGDKEAEEAYNNQCK